MTSSKRGVAYHEAGHAVVDILLGIPFKEVSLCIDQKRVHLADGTSAIAVYFIGVVPDEEYQRREIEKREKGILDDNSLLSTMAGPAAEMLAGGTNEDGAGAELDLLPIAHALRVSTGDDRVLDMASDAMVRVAPLLQDHWGAVEAVAAALLKKKTLTMAEAQSIITEKTCASVLDHEGKERENIVPTCLGRVLGCWICWEVGVSRCNLYLFSKIQFNLLTSRSPIC